MKQDILSLMMAYPEYITGVEKDYNDNVYVVMVSGKKILYDDKKNKNHNQKLSNPDIQDALEQIYPLETENTLMDENFDPGRGRIYSLLEEVYGGWQGIIEKNLIRTKTGYEYRTFNKNNNASKSLEKAMDEILMASKSNKKIYSYVFPTNGTYNFRYVAGTGRLSPHAFGIAIDLKSDPRDYWKWSSREKGEERIKSYPKEIVKIFENNNFIWGGKWGHFDILHFEYRPEILIKARYFKEYNREKPWHYGYPDNDKVKKYIEEIDNVLK